MGLEGNLSCASATAILKATPRIDNNTMESFFTTPPVNGLGSV
jgi:hypothetical protein